MSVDDSVSGSVNGSVRGAMNGSIGGSEDDPTDGLVAAASVGGSLNRQVCLIYLTTS